MTPWIFHGLWGIDRKAGTYLNTSCTTLGERWEDGAKHVWRYQWINSINCKTPQGENTCTTVCRWRRNQLIARPSLALKCHFFNAEVSLLIRHMNQISSLPQLQPRSSSSSSHCQASVPKTFITPPSEHICRVSLSKTWEREQMEGRGLGRADDSAKEGLILWLGIRWGQHTWPNFLFLFWSWCFIQQWH